MTLQQSNTASGQSAELATMLQDMERVARTFLTEVETFVRQWYWLCAEFYVTKYYDQTRDLGPARLSEMKASLTQIDAATSALVTRLIGRAEFWVHRAQGEQWSGVDFSKGAPKELASAVASVTNEIKPILRRYGYLPSSDKFDSNCPDPNTWPEPLITLVDKYRSLVRRGLFLKTEIKVAEEEQKKQEARNLWRDA